MKVQLPLGDIVDKVTILLLKRDRIDDQAKVENVVEELRVLEKSWAEEGLVPMDELDDWSALREVNGELWDVEDKLRLYESRQDFGTEFVELARSVYHLNDRRASLKRSINLALGSDLIEEKSYQDYSAEASS
jgi:hypothetical protein